MKINNLLNINELCDLLADNILADNIFTKEKISLKSRVFMNLWCRANTLPKNLEKSKNLIEKGLKYEILKKHITIKLKNEIGEKKTNEILEEFYKIENLIK
jgi:hypothetical protein